MNSKQALRQQLRQARRALNLRQQDEAAYAVMKHLRNQLWFRKAKRLGFYLAADGELSPHYLLDLAQGLNKDCFLPVLHPLRPGHLHFASVSPGQTLRANRFGIPEPQLNKSRVVKPAQLEVVFLPLVGFDRQGNRLGMGGGFYDRSFAFMQQTASALPRLVGLAHSCQEVEHLENNRWDIPLQAIATDREWIEI